MTGPNPAWTAFEAPPPAEEGGSWLVMLTDLVCLLLTFFVLLFAMSHVDEARWRSVADKLALARPAGQPALPVPATETNDGGQSETAGVNLGYLGRLLDTQTRASHVLQKSVIYLLGERLVLSLPGGELFEGNGAALASSGMPTLGELGNLLQNIANDVVVIGHADAGPAAVDAENWKLSLARAVAVADTLRRAGYGRPIPAFGAGVAELGDLPQDLPAPQRRGLAERVDIIVTPNKGW